MIENGIPTESRIFADRLMREQKVIERRQAGQLSPGTDSWPEAMAAFGKRFARAEGPIKRAAMLRSLEERFAIKKSVEDTSEDILRSVYPISSRVGRRSGRLGVLTFSVSNLHPYGIDENRDGIAVHYHTFKFDRSGRCILPRMPLLVSYVCHHALARLHQRCGEVLVPGIGGVQAVAYLGTLGYLLAPYERSQNAEVCLTIGDVIFVGVLRQSTAADLWFLDVRTTLPSDSPGAADKRERGLAASRVVWGYWNNENDGRSLREIADQVPLSPTAGSDYISQGRNDLGRHPAINEIDLGMYLGQ